MKRWEYMIADHYTNDVTNAETLLECLNKYGEAGWSLVSKTYYPGSGFNELIFVREKVETKSDASS